jgi:hypothetical protein
MGQFIDLTGKRFGKLTVIKRTENGSGQKPQWLCLCDCGKSTIVRGDHLRSGWHTMSCGCMGNENRIKATKTHGDTGKRLYRIWVTMISRCESLDRKDSRLTRNYRDRGIRVCQEWHSYEIFKAWAFENGYRDDLTIDRIDNNGNYEPSNCRWADGKTQANNTRRNINITYRGKTMTLKQWSVELGIKYRTLSHRIMELGWSIETAFATPVDMRYSHTEWRNTA